MRHFEHKISLRDFLNSKRNEGQTIGLVPTMGALHAGHLSLMRRALEENNFLVVSIFVNPTQFDNPEDLEKYPKTLDKDLALLEEFGDNIAVFTPSVTEMYEDNVASAQFSFDGLENQMEGKFRTGHFDGVGTIVKRLFELVEPDNAYFGEKDFQQLQIIRKLVEKHNIPVKITGCPISREENGLAMSSRNERLNPEIREKASFIYKTINNAREQFGIKNAQDVTQWIEDQFDNQNDFQLEYAIIADENTLETVKTKEENKNYRLFIAVYANDIRLIDNIALN